MASAVDALDSAARRLDDTVESARLAGAALDGASARLADRVAEVARRADEVRIAVARTRDALIDASAP